MKQITAIHVDDNRISLDAFSGAVETVPGLLLLKSFTDAEGAFAYLQANKVDVLFSDIEMPGKDGFWLAGQNLDPQMEIVFVTAHAGYALNAFEVCALDYLVKPVQVDRLRLLVEHIRRRPKEMPVQSQIKELFNNYMDAASFPKKIFVQTVGVLHIVMLDEVMYFSANGAYTTIHYKNGKELLSSKLIKTYENALKNHPDFIRTHRSFLVNKAYVIKLDHDIGKFTLTLSNGCQLEGSQRRKDEVIKQLMA